MIGTIKIRDRGNAPRGFKRAFGNSSKKAYQAAAEYFEDHFRDRRFTEAHARAAGYVRRKGELKTGGARRRSYVGRKEREFGHNNPLEYSGRTRRAVQAGGRIQTTKNRARIRYSGASKFSLRHPKSQIRMQEEFRRMLPEELEKLGEVYDRKLDQLLRDARYPNTRSVG